MLRRFGYATVLVLSLLAACKSTITNSTDVSGNGDVTDAGFDVVTDSGSTGGAGGAAPDGGLCAAGAFCAASTLCCEGLLLLACMNETLAIQQVCTPDETCDATSKTCLCNPGTKRCTDGTTAEVCKDVDGTPTWVAHSCPDGCIAGACTETNCIIDALDCSSDAKSVVQCSITEDGAKQHLPVFDCVTKGYENGCKAPSMPSTNLEEYCINACNVVGVPLSAPLCSSAPPPLGCAVFICDPTGQSLVPDHEECRGPGATCLKNEQCLSCFCNAGLCLGGFPKKCAPATMLCPP